MMEVRLQSRGWDTRYNQYMYNLMEVGLQSAAFVFGAIVGSFLNVVLLRKNTGETVVYGRSRCFSCGKEITWYDNIPIISYVVLGGKCRNCHSTISIQYPLVELLVGLLAVLVFINIYTKSPVFSFSTITFVEFLFYFGAMSALFAVAAYDARTKIIDRHLLYIFAGFSVVTSLVRWRLVAFSWHTMLYDICAAGAIWLFFWALYYVSDETWMGRGDCSVAFWCAMFLGHPLSIAMFLFSFWFGGILGALILIEHQIKVFRKMLSGGSAMKMQIPFAPFLALGTFAAWYFADILKLFYQLLF